MRRVICFAALCLTAAFGAAAGQDAQGPPQAAKILTVASVLDSNLSIAEHEVLSAAEAMPEEKYSFTPSAGEFGGGAALRSKCGTSDLQT